MTERQLLRRVAESRRARAAWARVSREPLVLIALAVVAGALWGFVELADEVVEGDTHAVDERLLLALRNPADPSDPIGPEWVEELFRDATALGGNLVQVFLVAAVTGYLWLERRRRTVAVLLVAVLGGVAISAVMKGGFSRPRPDLVPHESYVITTSFPSQHAMTSAVTYLTLGALLAKAHRRRRIKLYFITCAIALTLLVGVSRVYLGVHWPTDVLAGWAAGAAWAVLWWLIARWLQRHVQVEPEAQPPPAE